ncbi:SDR family NAD(P)-dependent oxidoreductase [Thioclava sp. NG1]|uniref:SDR family oxidoreductase n=1 Tax=unclassified Thioclava TaxID=2621713 RepID=UPI000B547574|nr:MULTISPECIES: SDR family oxidoreductase [unclassified Thioclava]OWY12526.1 short-chain dehydrogenase [Thioclava sp. F34-6]PWE49603.1 SDR family NAD(P)-dependent oxidoreductase [Thioclava sp. NG1]
MSKIILITGASTGIGESCARHAVEAGHKVALVARSADKLEALVKDLGEENALALPTDVTDPDAQERMVARAVEHYGRLDVVLANAGVGASARGTEAGSVESFQKMIEVNCLAVTYTAKFTLPHLRASKGHMVLTGSKASQGAMFGSVYSATKWFIRGYADNLGEELGEAGGRVTCLHPGMVDTPFFDEAKPDALRPDDIARAFLFAIDQPDHVLIPHLPVYPKPKKD